MLEIVGSRNSGDRAGMAEAPFKDHFSHDAGAYSRYRPQYPEALFSYLASLCPRPGRAWDCGCGSGQATLGLAPLFRAVDATDPSAEQLAKAPRHPRIAYTCAAAEASALPAGAIDLIVAAQAAHWFDFDAFYAEVRRVAKPRAIIALVSYHRMRVGRDIDPITEDFHRRTLGPYWPPERAHVDAAYRTIPFPFEEIDAPDFALRASWSLVQVLGYLGTWSAVKQYRRDTGNDPLDPVAAALRAAWGDPGEVRSVTWPIHSRLGQVFGT
jgi:SAM-dependent methyltransferase